MCHARDWRRFDERTPKKAEERPFVREQPVIEQLIKEAQEQAAKAPPAKAPAREAAPAK